MYTPDPSNAPGLSVSQQFQIFLNRWWRAEDFALVTARTTEKIVTVGAHPITGGNSVAFLGRLVRINSDHPEVVQTAISMINKTQEILTWKNVSDTSWEDDMNLWYHTIGSR